MEYYYLYQNSYLIYLYNVIINNHFKYYNKYIFNTYTSLHLVNCLHSIGISPSS